LARLISLIEGGKVEEKIVVGAAHVGAAHGRDVPVLGVTGTGGAGKSSVTDELVRRFRLDQDDALNIAVIAVDPSRRKSGGALLGDRIRMNALSVGAAPVGAAHGRDGTRAAASVEGAPTTDELLEDFAHHYAQRCGRRGRLYPEAARVLARLRNAGVKLALLTNKEQRFVRFLLEVHGLDGDFDLEVCGDSMPTKKPDPLPVRHCLRHFQVPAARALLVGDSAVDVETARNAGIAAWAVDYGYNQGQPIGRSRPDRVIGELAEVLAPFADRIAAAGSRYSPRASSSSLYFRSNPRN